MLDLGLSSLLEAITSLTITARGKEIFEHEIPTIQYQEKKISFFQIMTTIGDRLLISEVFRHWPEKYL